MVERQLQAWQVACRGNLASAKDFVVNHSDHSHSVGPDLVDRVFRVLQGKGPERVESIVVKNCDCARGIAPFSSTYSTTPNNLIFLTLRYGLSLF